VSKYNLTNIKFPNKLIPKNTLRRNIMGDILKEAIADAKAVRETALENAKMALEEAFTPQIKSMLSAKLKEEEDDTEDEGMHDEGEHEDEAEEGEHEEGMRENEGEHEEGMREEDDDEAEEGRHEEGEHEEGEHAEEGEDVEEDDDDMEENLDLEAIIKELESELTEEDDDDDAEEGRGMKESEAVEESEEIEEEYEIDEAALEEEEELEEVDKSSGIGKGDNKNDDTDKSSGIGGGDNKLSEVQAELKEYKEAVSFLKDKLHEVNILNAKLLFTNKLFKQYSLDNNQKLKVVETFDRAQTTREIKLVYSTLAEQFGDNTSIVTKKSISESASSAVASTKPSEESKKVISEEVQVADRFRKLAGLIK
jgi:hypothetical protein